MPDLNVPIIKANGLLWIGDPHQDSRTPGRRKEEFFYKTIARKIKQCMKIAQDRNLIPVFGGDFFNRDNDSDPAMLVETIHALQSTGHKPWTLVGNHEKRQTVLTQDTALSILVASKVLNQIPNCGPAFILESTGFNHTTLRVGVGGTAYDQEVPSDVTPFFEEVQDIVWLTHHDWIFEGSYPNAMHPYPIKGCSMVINGHIHKSKPPVKRGHTVYWNPGNITRMSIDTKDQVPRVWEMIPGQANLSPIALEHEKEVFDLTGRRVHAAEDKEQSIRDQENFAKLLAIESSQEETKTQDGSLFLERMSGFFAEYQIDEKVQTHLQELFKKVRHKTTEA